LHDLKPKKSGLENRLKVIPKSAQKLSAKKRSKSDPKKEGFKMPLGPLNIGVKSTFFAENFQAAKNDVQMP
jgi:hypothetical protein